MSKREETLIFGETGAHGTGEVFGTAPENLWRRNKGERQFVPIERQKAELEVFVNNNCQFFTEPTEDSVGVSIPMRNMTAWRRAIDTNVLEPQLLRDMLEVIADVLAQESWWSSDFCHRYFPDLTKKRPTEQYFIGTEDGYVRLWNFDKTLDKDTLFKILTVFSRAYACTGTNIYNVLTDIVISTPKADFDRASGVSIPEAKVIWLNPELLKSGSQEEWDLCSISGTLAHEVGHMALDSDLAYEEYAYYSMLPAKLANIGDKLKKPPRKRGKMNGVRKDHVASQYALTGIDEEMAEMFREALMRPREVRNINGYDTGYLSDSLTEALRALGYPQASELRRHHLHWQRRCGQGIIYPKLSVDPATEFHPIVQYRDKFVRFVDYQDRA